MACENELKPIRPMTARERAPPISLSARRLHVSRPLSAVPVVRPPPGLAPGVVEKHWPDFEPQHAGTGNGQGKKDQPEISDNRDIADKRNIEPRPFTPVRWLTLECPTALACGEQRGSTRPWSAHQIARSRNKRGKYQMLYPSHPHPLRPDTNTAISAQIVSSTTVTAKREKLQRLQQDDEKALAISQKMEAPVLTHRAIRKHMLDQDTILHVASNLPVACDGRLILDPKLKQVPPCP
jgi:hypothetical protein